MAHRLPVTALALALAASAALAGAPAAQAARVQASASHVLAQRQALGLSELHDFQMLNSSTDELGMTHARFQQTFQGVKVFGGEVITHMDRAGVQRGMTLAHQPIAALNTTPSLTAGEALGIAHRALAPKGGYVSAPTAELLIVPETETVVVRANRRTLEVAGEREQVVRYTLAYHVHTELENGTEETAHTDFLLNAHTGAVIDRWSTLHTAGATGTGNSQFSGTVTINTNSTGTGYELRDTTRGTGGTFGNNVVTDLAHATSGNGTIYTDADNTWGDGANYVEGSSTTAANGQTAAVDAAFGIQRTWDYYGNVLGRNGIDGTGKASYLRVHYSNSYDNAFWSDSCFCMTFGDGSSFQTLTSIDVAGHEMSHGVCATTANLTYRGESGGLNEANSDIHGTMVEFYAHGGGTTAVPNYTAITSTISTVGGTVPAANYLIGEQLETSSFNHPLRWMYKPSLDGSSKDAWSTSLKRLDVHYSSGPANHFFFLLAHGSQVDAFSGNIQSPLANGVTSITGIGNDKAARIWFRAMVNYMTSSTVYSGARTACLSAATDLYGAGSAEYNAVNLAWKAVNVL
ncbi:MAG TPA: M4 family metallopeptidase [Holophagaceae bacterium]|nr:M4 family metallopeptidase [Holophagaceae bacterium]